MVATTDRFEWINVTINPIAQIISGISAAIVDGDRIHIAFTFGEPPAAGDEGFAELEVLREIYNSANGFRSEDLSPLAPVVENLGDLGVTAVEDIPTAYGGNPFAIETPEQESTAISLGYGHYSLILWQDVLDANVATTTAPNTDTDATIPIARRIAYAQLAVRGPSEVLSPGNTVGTRQFFAAAEAAVTPGSWVRGREVEFLVWDADADEYVQRTLQQGITAAPTDFRVLRSYTTVALDERAWIDAITA